MSDVAYLSGQYRAATGVPNYDQIVWSAPPMSKLVAASDSGVQAIRHFGSRAPGTLQTRSLGNQRRDALLLARRPCGLLEARVGGTLKSSQLTRDLCCYLPHGADVDLEYPTTSQGLILHFPAGMLASLFKASERVELEPEPGFRSPGLASVMLTIEQELASPGFGSDLLLDGYYRCVAALLARTCNLPSRSPPDRLYISPVRLRRVIDYIEDNLAEKITIKQLADVAGISMFHFSRVFKKSINQTPYQYVCSRRLQYAQLLMSNGRHSLMEIGLSCGFSNQAHFTNAFLKQTGMPPGKFRRIMMSDN